MDTETQYKKILLTAFQGTSSEMLLNEIEGYPVLILPNDKVKMRCITNEGTD